MSILGFLSRFASYVRVQSQTSCHYTHSYPPTRNVVSDGLKIPEGCCRRGFWAFQNLTPDRRAFAGILSLARTRWFGSQFAIPFLTMTKRQIFSTIKRGIGSTASTISSSPVQFARGETIREAKTLLHPDHEDLSDLVETADSLQGALVDELRRDRDYLLAGISYLTAEATALQIALVESAAEFMKIFRAALALASSSSAPGPALLYTTSARSARTDAVTNPTQGRASMSNGSQKHGATSIDKRSTVAPTAATTASSQRSSSSSNNNGTSSTQLGLAASGASPARDQAQAESESDRRRAGTEHPRVSKAGPGGMAATVLWAVFGARTEEVLFGAS